MMMVSPKLKIEGRLVENQSLTEHVSRVEREAERIAKELGLKDPVLSAFLFAARWHDEGKKADIWQRFVYGIDPTDPVGKAAVTRDPKSLKGYRHEFGSLLRLSHPDRHGTKSSNPPDEDICDLAFHLIATHHGCARPHFENSFDREFLSDQCEALHSESLRRFSRLQQRYGWWHLAWLENLLRCADALGSADPEAEDEPDGSTEESGAAR